MVGLVSFLPLTSSEVTRAGWSVNTKNTTIQIFGKMLASCVFFILVLLNKLRLLF